MSLTGRGYGGQVSLKGVLITADIPLCRWHIEINIPASIKDTLSELLMVRAPDQRYLGLDQHTRWLPTRNVPTSSRVVYRHGTFCLHRSGAAWLILVGLLVSLPYLAGAILEPAFGDPLFQAMALAAAWTATVTPLHHELAHALVANRAGISVVRSGFHFGGAYVVLRPPSTGVTVRDWIRTLAAGCASNLTVGGALVAGWLIVGDGWYNPAGVFVILVAGSELCVGIVNAIPQPRSDGGAVAEAMRLARSPLAT